MLCLFLDGGHWHHEDMWGVDRYMAGDKGDWLALSLQRQARGPYDGSACSAHWTPLEGEEEHDM